MLYSHRNVKTQQHEFALEAASFWATQNLWGKRHQLDFCKVILAISILFFFFFVVFSVREHATQRAPFCIQDFVPSLKNELTPLGILPLFDTRKEVVHFSSSWPTKKEKVYGFVLTSSLFIYYLLLWPKTVLQSEYEDCISNAKQASWRPFGNGSLRRHSHLANQKCRVGNNLIVQLFHRCLLNSTKHASLPSSWNSFSLCFVIWISMLVIQCMLRKHHKYRNIRKSLISVKTNSS